MILSPTSAIKFANLMLSALGAICINMHLSVVFVIVNSIVLIIYAFRRIVYETARIVVVVSLKTA